MQRILAAAASLVIASAGMAGDEIKWTKYKLDGSFWGEGVAIGDINKDGRMDVFAGEVWFEQLPAADGKIQWKRHEVRPLPEKGLKLGPNGESPYDGGKRYSHTFACFAGDFNGDGWVDFINVDFPGEAFSWWENPGAKGGHFIEHKLWRSGCNETPTYGDLLGDGKPGLCIGSQPEGKMLFLRPGEDPTKLWVPKVLSKKTRVGTDKFYHGLGFGDVNRDGRLDVLTPDGWWEQPAEKSDAEWKFHKNDFQPAAHTPPDPNRENRACADMFATDVNGDGKMDVISSSAHKYGVWWFENIGTNEAPQYKPHVIREDFSESHAMHFQDVDGDGEKDIITGKRYYSHMRGEHGSGDAAIIVWIKISKENGQPKFTSHLIDDDSGVGTQFVAADFNGDGKIDVVTSNKKGVHVFIQESSGKASAAKPTTKAKPASTGVADGLNR